MNDIQKIAMHYGFANQCQQAIEEMAELTVAISKLHRDWNEEHYDNLLEELADVEIMLDQLKYLSGGRYQVEKIREYKIQRQIERIENERREDGN